MEAVHRGFARVREAGRIVDLPFGHGSRVADFGHGPEKSFVIPWGDVATAFYTTGIPNVAVHVPWRSSGASAIRALLPFRRLLAAPLAVKWTQWSLRRVAGGPSEHRRSEEKTHVWGEVRDTAGNSRTAS